MRDQRSAAPGARVVVARLRSTEDASWPSFAVGDACRRAMLVARPAYRPLTGHQHDLKNVAMQFHVLRAPSAMAPPALSRLSPDDLVTCLANSSTVRGVPSGLAGCGPRLGGAEAGSGGFCCVVADAGPVGTATPDLSPDFPVGGTACGRGDAPGVAGGDAGSPASSRKMGPLQSKTVPPLMLQEACLP